MADQERRIISLDRSVIPAADVSAEKYPDLLKAISGVPGIEAVKVGFALGYRLSLPRAVGMAHDAGLKVIFDHQKASTDIPDTGKEFAAVCKEAGVDAAILFPQSGPVTQAAWIKSLQDADVPVIVGGEMTHKGYLQSEQGYIDDDAPEAMYALAATLGVRDFVVPGNRPERVGHYKSLLDALLGEGSYSFQSPGFIDQGGNIADYAEAAGDRWHAIVGRGITAAENMREAAMLMTSQIR